MVKIGLQSLKLDRIAVFIVTLMLVVPSAVFADVGDINGQIDICSKKHGYDPYQRGRLGANELGKNERVFLECVYTGIEKVIMPKALLPDEYKHLIGHHREMTDAVEKGEMTRQQRGAEVQKILNKVKAREVAESERRIQELSEKRDQYQRMRQRMLRRHPRMF